MCCATWYFYYCIVCFSIANLITAAENGTEAVLYGIEAMRAQELKQCSPHFQIRYLNSGKL
jgi:hypothetical protein